MTKSALYRSPRSGWTILTGFLLASALLGCDATAPPTHTTPASTPATPEASATTRDPAEHAARTGGPHKLTSLPPLLPAAEIQAGWLMLFDGQTLFGWEPVGKAQWESGNGEIRGNGKERGFLRTTTPFSDYELSLEFRAPESTNSGVFLHTERKPRSPPKHCYELNIAPADNPFPTGSFVQRKKVGDAQRQEALRKGRNGWHHYHVLVSGGQCRVELNGVEVLQYTDPAPLRRGYIALQQNSGPVAFRNVRIRPLNLTSIFNGKDLTGWRTHPDLSGQFTVTPQGELRVQGGRGQLEFDGLFADFILQLEAKTGAPLMNSGVFFRCIPHEVMMGYESQIHNGYRDGDRTQPLDCGTGGIFRRQDARIVAADDETWFGMTLIADGAHFAVWVNGLQVTDWVDTRPPNENPRRGLRTEPGTIMLQAHDPTTDVRFRNLRAAALTMRHSD